MAQYIPLLRDLDFDIIADVPVGSSTLAWQIASQLNKPMITPRLKAKDYGSDNLIVGRFKKGQRVLIIDDVIVRATKKQEAIDLMKKAGLTVVAVIAFIDWRLGGENRLSKQGIITKSVITAQSALDILRISGVIIEDTTKLIK